MSLSITLRQGCYTVPSRHKTTAGQVLTGENVSVERLPETMQAPRLSLRRWVPGDAVSLGAAITDNIDHLRPWMPWIAAEPQSAEDRVALIDQWRTDWERGGDVVIGALLDGVVVGSAGLHRRRGPRVLEIGYWVHGDHVRKGFATEIADALTTAAFTVPDIDRVEIHHDKANIASSRIPRVLGFNFADESPIAILAPGEIGIDCRWIMLRQQWIDRPTAAT
jgi:ribosomal-protein-serine acetyltransferase